MAFRFRVKELDPEDGERWIRISKHGRLKIRRKQGEKVTVISGDRRVSGLVIHQGKREDTAKMVVRLSPSVVKALGVDYRDEVFIERKSQPRSRLRRIILLADGNGNPHSPPIAARACKAERIVVDVVGLVDGTVQEELLREIADITNGTYTSIDSLVPAELAELATVFEESAKKKDKDKGRVETCVLALDCSESMRGHKFDQARRAAASFLEEKRRMDEGDRVGCVGFNGEAYAVFEPTTQYRSAESQLVGLQLRLGTDIGKALDLAREMILGKKKTKATKT